jgi:hypothetical protein
MAALAICAVIAALLRRRTDTRAPGADPARSAAARRPGNDPAQRPGDRPPARPTAAARRRRALAGPAPPSPGPLSLVPPAHPARQDHPAQPNDGCCGTKKCRFPLLMSPQAPVSMAEPDGPAIWPRSPSRFSVPRASRVGTGRIWTYLVPGRTGVPGSVRAGVPRHSEVLSGWARRPSRVNWRVRRQPSSPAGRSRTR